MSKSDMADDVCEKLNGIVQELADRFYWQIKQSDNLQPLKLALQEAQNEAIRITCNAIRKFKREF